MQLRSRRLAVVLGVTLSALVVSGCSDGGPRSPSAAADRPTASPTRPAPPSTPVVEKTLRDTVDGTTVTPLAIVTDFPEPADTPPGVKPVLVEVRLHAGSAFSGEVFPSVVSITRHDADLDLVSLGLSNPDALVPAMAAKGYAPLQAVRRGQTSTAWIGAWMNEDVSEYDLVYDRREGKVIGGADNGEEIAASRSITPLTER
jgi:hypothetical protein